MIPAFSKSIAFALILTTVLQSCITKKVVTTGVSNPGYNNIVNVNPAQYNKRKTRFARWASPLAAMAGAGAGGAVGYFNAPKPKTGLAIGAVAGGLGFGGIVGIVNVTTKTGIRNAKSPKKWVRKYNKTFKRDYIPFDIKSPIAFQMIDKNMETNGNYKLYNVKDADNFFAAFPKNKTFKSLAQNAHTIMWRREIPEFINKYGDDAYNFEYKKAYINRSDKYNDLEEAENRYPGVVKDLESKYFGLVTNLSEARSFLKKYPSSNSKEALQDKSIAFIKNISDVDFIKDIFHESLKKELVVSKALSVIADGDIPRLVNLLHDAGNINTAKLRYINAQDGFKSYAQAVNLYPEIGMQASASANFSNYDWCWDEVKKLGWAKPKGLADNTFNKVRNDILNNYVKAKISSSPKYSIPLAVELRDYILYDPFLKPVADNFKEELDGYVRKAEFEVAKAEGVEGLIVFCERYPGTDEARSAKGELDKFVQKNIKVEISDWWAASGDRNVINDVLDATQALAGGTAIFNVYGGKRYNLFIGGQITNTSDKTLPIIVNGRFNVINRVTANILGFNVIDKTTDKTVDAQPFYTYIEPGETQTFFNFFQNFREGGGAQFLIAAGSDVSTINKNYPFNLTFGFHPERISKATLSQQDNTISQLRKFGNVPVQKSNFQALAERFGGDENSLFNNLRKARSEAVAQVDAQSARRKVELEQKNVLREANAQKEKEMKDGNAKRDAETQKAAKELQAKRAQWDTEYKTCVERVSKSLKDKLPKEDREVFGLIKTATVSSDVYTSPTFTRVSENGKSSGVKVNRSSFSGSADCTRETLSGAIDCFCEKYLKNRP